MRTSLAVLILAVLAAAGGIYGYVSARRNVNPYPIKHDEGTTAEHVRMGRQWQPDPRWLPAYLVAVGPRWTATPASLKYGHGHPERVIGYGLENRAAIRDGEPGEFRGWAFSAKTEKVRYRIASVGVGGLMGLLLGVLIVAACGLVPLTSSRKARSGASAPAADDDVQVTP